MSDYWTISVNELLDEYGLHLDDEKICSFVEDIKMIGEMEFEATGREFIPNPLQAEVDTAKALLTMKEDTHDRMIRGIKEGVAARRNVRLQDVSIDADGMVTYYP